MLPKLEVVYNEYKEAKGKFLERLSEFSEEERTFKPSEKEWSMNEVLEHLLISETLILQRFEKNPPKESTYKIGISGKAKAMMMRQFMKSSRKVAAPLDTLAPMGGKNYEELSGAFLACSAGLKKYLDDFPQEKMKVSVFKHPIAGGLNMVGTLHFFHDHIIHHGHQVERIITAMNS